MRRNIGLANRQSAISVRAPEIVNTHSGDQHVFEVYGSVDGSFGNLGHEFGSLATIDRYLLDLCRMMFKDYCSADKSQGELEHR